MDNYFQIKLRNIDQDKDRFAADLIGQLEHGNCDVIIIIKDYAQGMELYEYIKVQGLQQEFEYHKQLRPELILSHGESRLIFKTNRKSVNIKHCQAIIYDVSIE